MIADYLVNANSPPTQPEIFFGFLAAGAPSRKRFAEPATGNLEAELVLVMYFQAGKWVAGHRCGRRGQVRLVVKIDARQRLIYCGACGARKFFFVM